MSDSAVVSTGKTWLKTMVGTMFGLISGAVVMWVSPLLDKVIKPEKPVANFAIEHSGLTVIFHNKSQGGHDGRWDFGDGTPLEFVPADTESVKHTYPKPGNYAAKFTLTNLVREQDERTVSVEVTDGKAKVVEKPDIVDLHVRPPGKVGEVVFAPASFQFEATADNAQLFVWDFGDGSGMQVGDAQMSHTYATPGNFVAKVAVHNGKERTQQETRLMVSAPPVGTVSVSMKIADEGVQLEKKERTVVASGSVTLTKKGPATMEKIIAASVGCDILAVKPNGSQNQNVELVSYQVAPDKKSVKVVAKLVQPNAATTAVLNEKLTIVEASKQKASREPTTLATTIAPPGSTNLKVPKPPTDWTDVRRQLAFEVRQNNQLLWQGATLPRNVPVSINGKNYTLAATQVGSDVQVSLLSGDSGVRRTSFP